MEHTQNILPSFLIAVASFSVMGVLFLLSPSAANSNEVNIVTSTQVEAVSDSPLEIKLPDFLTRGINIESAIDTANVIYADPPDFNNIPSLNNKQRPSIPFFYLDKNYLHIGTFGFGHKYIPTNQTKIDGTMENSWLFRQSIYRNDGVDNYIKLETNEEEQTIGYGFEYRF